ncbi:protein kinase domain-containing protein ppk32-like [Tropilaelaps mercedesae]|uniref:Protein kinase domain-containing protein ppk32-like n=1 Tax=Tropilaelaps mercedesae TaxID=418985 RepID=A0A1V9X963_9ACAR|nr:protein kinase domain-containing protein ppk32-like [Tropilaelaps mercedesae]
MAGREAPSVRLPLAELSAWQTGLVRCRQAQTTPMDVFVKYSMRRFYVWSMAAKLILSDFIAASSSPDSNLLRVQATLPGRRHSDNTIQPPRILVAPCSPGAGSPLGYTSSGVPVRRHSSVGMHQQDSRFSNFFTSPKFQSPTTSTTNNSTGLGADFFNSSLEEPLMASLWAKQRKRQSSQIRPKSSRVREVPRGAQYLCAPSARSGWPAGLEVRLRGGAWSGTHLAIRVVGGHN